MSIILGVPAAVINLNQQGLIEREFYDGLFPNLTWRAEALWEPWPEHSGTEIFMTRPGLLKPKTKALKPATDPTPGAVPYEQWVARLDQYGDTLDTHMPTSATSNADLFLRNIHQLGLQAGQSINRIARNALVKAYVGGQTCTTAAAGSTDAVLQVAALNGFQDVVVPTGTVRPVAVSPSNPLPITIGVGATAISRSVIGVQPNDPNDPDGPGLLILNAAVGGSGYASRTSVVSTYAPTVLRAGGGASVDGISLTDQLSLQLCINGVAKLRQANVLPHEDGYYHAHVSPLGNAQFFADPVFQRLNQSLPEGSVYKDGFVGTISGIMFFMDNEAPDNTNTGDRILTGTNAYYSSDIATETTNDSNVNIGRVVMTGRGAIYEKGLDESVYATEAGLNGKVGEFDVVNNGISILTERIRLILRSPMDRLQQMVSATWSITTAFGVPSDITAPSGPQRFKRAIVLEHAL
jgi:hypothetical protein